MDPSPSIDDMDLFLQAVRSVTVEEETEGLKSELEVVKSQLTKVTKRLQESLHDRKKQQDQIDNLKKERISLKKDLIETRYEAKQNENLLKNCQEEVSNLKSELKAKGALIVTLERERRRLEIEVNKISNSPNGFSRQSRSRDRSTERGRRSASADRTTDLSYSRADPTATTRRTLGKELLKGGEGTAYTASTHVDVPNLADGYSNGQSAESGQVMEKVVLLQKLLLSKIKHLAEKEVMIEQLKREKEELGIQASRLKKTKNLALELTECRHRLNQKTHQLEQLITENTKLKVEVAEMKVELSKLRGRIHELYTERSGGIR